MEQILKKDMRSNTFFINDCMNFSNLDAPDSLIDNLEHGKLNFIRLGVQNYRKAWTFQKKIHAMNKDGKIPDIVFFLEHENVYTFGKNADKNYLLTNHPDADVIETDRGGEVTYHGPGQLVGYPIINLNNYEKSITWFMRSLEDVIINSLKYFRIPSSRKDGLPGVWVGDEKICAMGVKIAQWVTMHGFALNVNPDMRFYDGMIPCGIMEYGITSLEEQKNKNIDMDQLINIISSEFLKTFK